MLGAKLLSMLGVRKMVNSEFNNEENAPEVEDAGRHPLQELIGAGKDAYDDFDLAKERETMWPR
jgi:hypothetical protein